MVVAWLVLAALTACVGGAVRATERDADSNNVQPCGLDNDWKQSKFEVDVDNGSINWQCAANEENSACPGYSFIVAADNQTDDGRYQKPITIWQD